MDRPVRHRGSWRIRWTDEKGIRRSATFKDYDDAKGQLRARKLAVYEIRRGLRSAVLPDKSFNDLCDYWIANRAPQKRSRKDDECIIRRHLRPAFGLLRVREVGIEVADRFVVDHDGLHKKTVSNILTLLLSMLRVAVDLGWAEKVPRIRKPRVRMISSDFRYLRTADEISEVLRAAQAEGDMVFALYCTAVYTGMRAGELAGLLWADVDMDRRLITVQRSYGGPTKAEDVRYVPILDPLLPVLRTWRLRKRGRLVFANRSGRMFQPSASVFQEVLHRILARTRLSPGERRGRRRNYIVFHDLRHTFASHWVTNGGDIFRLQRILGHKSIQMTQRYAHLAPAEYAKDWGRLGSASPADAAKVIDMPRPGLVAARD